MNRKSKKNTISFLRVIFKNKRNYLWKYAIDSDILLKIANFTDNFKY